MTDEKVQSLAGLLVGKGFEVCLMDYDTGLCVRRRGAKGGVFTPKYDDADHDEWWSRPVNDLADEVAAVLDGEATC